MYFMLKKLLRKLPSKRAIARVYRKLTKPLKKAKFEQQDYIIFGIAFVAVLFAIWQVLAAQARTDLSHWTQYSNEEGNFSFRYPPEWGNAEQRQFDFPDRPNYFYAAFSENSTISFGGSLDGYEHPGRLVAPTDDPGFVRAAEGGFFTPGNSSSNIEIPANRLAIIEGIEAKCLYNYQEYSDTYGAAFGIIRCNLDNPPFQGVNFVITNPDDNPEDLDRLYKLISTFEKTAQ